MTTTLSPATERGRRGFPGWRIVAVFAITQTIGYGTLYYSFAVLLHPMTHSLHTSAATITGAFATAILAQALVTAPIGRWLDRHGGRALMTAGSALGVLMLIAWSQVHTAAQLYAVFAGLGVAMAMALYDPATAVIVSWFDPARRPRAILGMIVVAGFASIIFMPLTGLLNDRYGWRTTLLVLAAVYGTVAVPLHTLVVRRPPISGHPHLHRAGLEQRRTTIRMAVRDGKLWLLAGGFVAHAAAMSAMTVHLVGYLVSRGQPATFAATVAGLLGVLSVTGRLLLTAGRRLPLHRLVALVISVQAIAAICLPWTGDSRIGAVLTVTAFGLGFGVASLATPQLLAARYGATAYGSIAGIVATPVTLAKAGAPLAAAAITACGGSPADFPSSDAAGATSP